VLPAVPSAGSTGHIHPPMALPKKSERVPAPAIIGRPVRTRRGLQIVLGLLWLLDGALQLQPFMLGSGFARQVIGEAAAGQPHFVAGPVEWAADIIAAHPLLDVPFAAVQLLLGVGMVVPRSGSPLCRIHRRGIRCGRRGT
jgi:hypothetical protein